MYIGRFAPSPTGPLHFGSLVAAVASYLDAKTHQGKWLVRIEDIDPPREIAGSTGQILRTLEAFSMFWDGPVMYQSTRIAAYETALAQLDHQGLIYPCTCSRKEIANASTTGIEGSIYPGTCRQAATHPERAAFAWRIRTNSNVMRFEDVIQGAQAQQLEQEIGDFVLKRADGLFAYQLAVVLDDYEQGVTNIVRGSDLLASTPRQIYLQKMMGFPTPAYAHVPIVTNANGEKLSKQTLAKPIQTANPEASLWQALHFLGQNPPESLCHESLNNIWGWAISHWDIARIPKQISMPEPEE